MRCSSINLARLSHKRLFVKAVYLIDGGDAMHEGGEIWIPSTCTFGQHCIVSVTVSAPKWFSTGNRLPINH